MTNEQLQTKLNELVIGLAQMREGRDDLAAQLERAEANVLRQEGAIMLLQQLLESNENNPDNFNAVSSPDPESPHH